MRHLRRWSIATAVFVFLTAALGVWLAGKAGSVAPVWLANAGALAFILRGGTMRRTVPLAATGATLLMVNLLGGFSPLPALALASLNIVEITAALVVIDRLVDRASPYAAAPNLYRLIFASAGCAPAFSGVLAAAVLPIVTGGDPVMTGIRWYLADAVGMIVLLPVLLTIGRADIARLRRPRTMAAVALAIMLTAAVTALVFAQPTYPLLFLIPPMLVFAAFRLRFAGAALAVAAVAIVAVPLTANGLGPIAHNLPALGDRILFLQLFLAVAVLSALPIAATLAERARLAASLADSERLYRLLAENSEDMIVRIGLDGVRRYVSPACRTMLGYEPDEMIGGGPMGQIHAEDRARVERVCRSLLDGVEAPVCAYRQLRRDGSYVWLEAIYRLVRDPVTDEPIEFVAGVRDISRRHDAELAATKATAVREESLRLLMMAEGMAGVGHWRLDATTDALFWSDEVYRIHGRDPACPPILAEGIDAYHPDDRDMVSGYVSRALAEGAHWRFQARIIRSDGELRHVVSHGQAEHAPNGDVVGLFGVFQDVTDRVSNEQLLIVSRDEARAAAEAKSAFLATMSHEIRTPMTGVLGMIELLRSDPATPQRDRYFDSLERSATMLMTMLDGVLDFSKLESRNLILESIDFDLSDLVGTVVNLFQNAASQKGLLLEPVGFDAPLWLKGDPVRLQQILSNLTSNAVKFTEAGSIRIGIDAVPVGHSCRIRIAVADTGIGIAQADQDRLFRPFVQADASTTRRFGGTGLGLAITHHLVEAMHGEIGIDSVPGVGSTFWFEMTLPVGKASSERPALRVRYPQMRVLRVLVAEDNPINQALVSALVTREGHDVTCVQNGALAVEAAAAGRYDLILMDMQMPVMDGTSATRAIREGVGPCANVPIVALTADASAGRRDIYRDIGLTDFLTKPIDTDLLSMLLDSIATGTPPAAPAATGTIEVAVLDEAAIERLETNLGRVNSQQLLAMLMTEARERPRRIADLIALGDHLTAQIEAHGLKGAASNVGAHQLARAAAVVEDSLRAGHASSVSALALISAADRTLAALGARSKRRAA